MSHSWIFENPDILMDGLKTWAPMATSREAGRNSNAELEGELFTIYFFKKSVRTELCDVTCKIPRVARSTTGPGFESLTTWVLHNFTTLGRAANSFCAPMECYAAQRSKAELTNFFRFQVFEFMRFMWCPGPHWAPELFQVIYKSQSEKFMNKCYRMKLILHCFSGFGKCHNGFAEKNG